MSDKQIPEETEEHLDLSAVRERESAVPDSFRIRKRLFRGENGIITANNERSRKFKKDGKSKRGFEDSIWNDDRVLTTTSSVEFAVRKNSSGNLGGYERLEVYPHSRKHREARESLSAESLKFRESRLALTLPKVEEEVEEDDTPVQFTYTNGRVWSEKLH